MNKINIYNSNFYISKICYFILRTICGFEGFFNKSSKLKKLTINKDPNISALISTCSKELLKHNNRVVIFGKGPSLSRVGSGEYRDTYNICVNDSYKIVENCKAVFFHDEYFVKFSEEIFSSDLNLVLPLELNSREKITAEGLNKLLKEKEFYAYRAQPFREGYSLLLDQECLLTLSGTVHSSIDFAYRIGAKHIHFVGFDGTLFKDKIYHVSFGDRKVSRQERLIYDKIKLEIYLLCLMLGVSFSFEP